MQPKKNWFLRKKDGSEYGPVSLSDLLRWSAQCRIVAGNAVSMDREEWTAVEEIPELEMHWMAHRADGKEYGPFALAAVQELFTHNVLPADAVLINRLTGENKPLSEVIDLPDGKDNTREIEKIEKVNDVEEVDAPIEEEASPANVDAPSEDEQTAETTTGKTEEAEEEIPAETVAPASNTQQPTPNNQRPTKDTRHPTPDSVQTANEQVEAALRNRLGQETAALLDQIEALRQELLDAQTKASESGRTYRAKIDSLEKKLQSAQQSALDADTRREALEDGKNQSQQQTANDIADLRKQTAFMKKNIAVLHAELDEARRQSSLRAKIILALGGLLTLFAALFIMRAAGGCSQRADIASPPPGQDRPETAESTGGDSRSVGGATTANTTNTWPSLRINGLRVDKRQDHLIIRFDEGAFASLTNFTPSASGQLKSLVDQLRPSLPAFRFVVEGHSDDTPMRATAAFADNTALAAARADTGAAFLKREGANAIASTNPGPPPYPNDSPENRSRNRTLLIKLYRQ